VQVTDTFPTGILTPLTAGPNGVIDTATGTVVWNLGDLAVGESRTVTLEAAVGTGLNPAIEQFTNTARVDDDGANGPDPTPLNNTATDTDLILSDVSGFVYIDLNNDGVFAGADVPIEGVSVNLTGVDARGNAVNLTTTTGADGMYCFLDLAPGLYDIIESQSQQFLDGKDTPGQVADALGTQSQLNLQVLDDQFARLAVGSGVSAQDFNFGEQMVMPTKRRYIR